ncbi:MAG: hypothetical protein JWR60_1939 [Polaromonas sp.]|nr:hypothetical protein [Polaromonas sp.]
MLIFLGNFLCRILLPILLLATMPRWASAEADSHRTIHIRGTTAFSSIVQSLAEQYMRSNPSATAVVSGGGTARGYLTLLDNTADVAMVSGTPSEDTEEQIARSGLKLVKVPFRRVAMAPAVHFSNPVNDLSGIQLREIFTGRINNWSMVGGKNAPIKVYVGRPGDGITTTWSEKILGDVDTFTPRAVSADLQERIAAVGRDPFGITYLATESIRNEELKALSVDQVMAGADSVHTGRYTLMAPLVFVTREKPSAEVQKFLQFVNTLSAPISNSVFALPAAR